jgi:hypothetical protein
MSYLNNLRLVFAGDFQADISTINNDVRHYDNSTFEPRFQEPFKNEYDTPDQVIYNGYFNPVGSGAFRLINCTVRGVYYQDGSSTTEHRHDEKSVGLCIDGSNNRVGAKLVDLDPQWQSSSQIWGLTIRLNDSNGNDLLVGQFEPAAFRDIWLRRQQNGADWDQPASAAFQSVLTNLQWSQDLSEYRFLQELKKATEASQEKEDRKLSIRLTTFGYKRDPKVNRFTLGRLVGAIGLYTPNEPHSFVLGRRMVPKVNERLLPINNINFFDCQVDEKNPSVLVDLGNALPLTIENENQDDEYVKLSDLGTLQLAVLCPQGNNYPDECETVTKDQDFIPLGSEIVYQHDKDPDWLNQTAGICSTRIPEEHYSLVLQQPLALIKMIDNSKGVVLIRESVDGLLIRAEDFVQRAEPGYPVNVTLFAARYGQSLPDAKVQISLADPDNDSGVNDGKNPPKAPSPYTNIPASALILPSYLKTNNEGKAVLIVGTSNPNNPRVYIDGQVYRINYKLEEQANEQQHFLDCAILLLFNAYQVPEQPTWIDHIKPIFQQYANLYPIMSQRLVALSDYDSVKKHRTILELAFSLDSSDPNYMPVSRDLSAAKRKTILKWLRQQNPKGEYTLFYGCVPVDREKQIVPPPQVELPDEPASKVQPAADKEISSNKQSYKNFK